LVNTIGAGRILTDRVDSLDQTKAENSDKSFEEVRKESISNIPIGRLGKPEEFAKMATFLVSKANSYVTGETILVDGGQAKAY